MTGKKSLSERYIRFILRHRFAAIAAILIVTGFFGYHVSSLRIATDFFSLYPPKHPYIQLYNEYRKMFGTANMLVAAVEVKEGDIYNLKTLHKIDRITQSLLTIPGCNPVQVTSITHPRVKDIKISSWGIEIAALIGKKFPEDQKDIDQLKEAVYRNAGVRGFYVSPDDKAATIFAGFWEEGADPNVVYERLETIRKQEADDNTNVYFTGYPVLYADIYHLAPQVYHVLGSTLVVMLVLLFFYFRSWEGVVLPLLSAGLSSVWGLGFASFLGYNLDPLILVVPVIITARVLSHTVQTHARYREEFERLGDKDEANALAYSEMLAPSALSATVDAVGVLLIAVATIPLMRHLAFFCSFWILTIYVSVPTFAPLFLSFLKPSEKHEPKHRKEGRLYKALARLFIAPSMGKSRWVVLTVMALVLVVGGMFSIRLKVGDTQAGAALLFPDHPYNKAFRFVNTKFVGGNQMVIIAEGKGEGALRTREALEQIEDFQRYMETEGGAGGSLTFTNMVKRIYRMFHEGHPKWEVIPDNPKHLGQIGFMLSGNMQPGEMDRWLDMTWSNATVNLFYRDYNNELITHTIAKAKEYINAQTRESDKVRFRLAGGILGILAAVNEEVAYSYWVSLIVVFLAVYGLCTFTYRSFAAGLVLIIPLAISQVISELFMLWRGIDLNINSLPVAAIAVGIGVDYGIFLVSRISEEYRATGDYDIANRRALQTTGEAIIFTATTMIAGVIFWIFVDLKFQAEMGTLLGLAMFLNMVNALICIPPLIKLLKPRFGSRVAIGESHVSTGFEERAQTSTGTAAELSPVGTQARKAAS